MSRHYRAWKDFREGIGHAELMLYRSMLLAHEAGDGPIGKGCDL
jgi:hypothetical protein